jgi:HEXXH motif-containing protein
MRVLDRQQLAGLQAEFRLSMRRLLKDLCGELHGDYADLAQEFGIRTSFLDLLASAIPSGAYANWKVVGWIESINDLLYMLDILKQWRDERHRAEFAAQFFDECQDKFFEHGYLDDLFPAGRPQTAGLEQRLTALCERLTQEVTQESLWFDPALSVQWCLKTRTAQWNVPGQLTYNAERGEQGGAVSVGWAGAWCEAPAAVRKALRATGGRVTFVVERTGISVKAGRTLSAIWTGWTALGRWHWRHHAPLHAVAGSEGVTIGPTLVYSKHRQPRAVVDTEHRQVKRILRAWTTVRTAWPKGYGLLALMTSRIIPLKAPGVVSFSYRHRPGLSFINCFDRDNLDLIDDLIHENSHHHLNLLLRKHVLYHGDHNQQIFYSPWRRSLRPLRGILHATFTFTMGAMLFERLSSWASGAGGAANWRQAGLTRSDLQRARFRCLEEVESVRYSLQDLRYADHHLGWLTGSGRRLVGQLGDAIERVHRNIRPYEEGVLRSTWGPALRGHVQDLERARRTFGPMKLTSA